MKKFVITILVTMMMLSLPLDTFASSQTTSESIEYFEDGSYVIITFDDAVPTTTAAYFSSTQTVTKSKTAKYYNTNDELICSLKVTGIFTYGNGTAKCTSSSVTANAYSSWKVSSKSASTSGATAIANATIKQYYNGTVIQSLNKTLKLTCSPTGTFS